MRLRFSQSRNRTTHIASFAATFAVAALAAEPSARADCGEFSYLGPVFGGLLAVPVGVGGAAISSGIASGINETREFSFGTGFAYGMLGGLGGAAAGTLLSYGVGCPLESIFIPSLVSFAFAAGAVAIAWSASPEVSTATSALGNQPMAKGQSAQLAVEIVKIHF